MMNVMHRRGVVRVQEAPKIVLTPRLEDEMASYTTTPIVKDIERRIGSYNRAVDYLDKLESAFERSRDAATGVRDSAISTILSMAGVTATLSSAPDSDLEYIAGSFFSAALAASFGFFMHYDGRRNQLNKEVDSLAYNISMEQKSNNFANEREYHVIPPKDLRVL